MEPVDLDDLLDAGKAKRGATDRPAALFDLDHPGPVEGAGALQGQGDQR
jgi:hypothetical protein